jgi:hypothetical protein
MEGRIILKFILKYVVYQSVDCIFWMKTGANGGMFVNTLLLLLWRFGPFSGHGLPNLLPLPRPQLRFGDKSKFYRVGLPAPRLTPTWSTRVSLFVWVITFDMSAWEPRASSCATAGIALGIL